MNNKHYYIHEKKYSIYVLYHTIVQWMRKRRLWRRIQARLRKSKSFIRPIIDSLNDPSGIKSATVDPNLIPLGDESEASLHAITRVQKRFGLKSNHIKGFRYT